MVATGCFLLSTVCLVLSILQFTEKGFCFNNAYIFATEEERKTMDKKPYYRQSAIVFSCTSCAFVFIGLYSVFQSSWMIIVAISSAVIALLYAIVSSVREYFKEK